MNTLEWRSLGLTGNNQLIEVNRQPVGRLIFNNSWKSSAEYNSMQRKTKFLTTNRFGKKVIVMHNGETKGQITLPFTSQPILRLNSGKKFAFTYNFFGSKLSWKETPGEPAMLFRNATMISMGRGSIEVSEALSLEEKDILISGALVLKNFVFKRMSYIFYLLMLITIAERMLSRFLA